MMYIKMIGKLIAIFPVIIVITYGLLKIMEWLVL